MNSHNGLVYLIIAGFSGTGKNQIKRSFSERNYSKQIKKGNKGLNDRDIQGHFWQAGTGWDSKFER
jgi:hypothetical protein